MQYWKMLKEEKLQAPTKYILKYQRQKLMTHFFDYAVLYINKALQGNGQKFASFLSPKKGDLGISKNYKGITLTTLVV